MGRSTEDPRQVEFLRLYLTPGTEYFNNALQSALKAGYSQEYSENILQFDLKWLQEGISELIGKPTEKKNLVEKAKKRANTLLDSEDDNVVAKVATFILKTDNEFSEKSETRIKLPKPILGGITNAEDKRADNT
jgi:hypothetical protein